jgi:hypothetical protein
MYTVDVLKMKSLYHVCAVQSFHSLKAIDMKMGKKQMNRQYMVTQVLAFIEDHGKVFQDNPQFQSLHNELIKQLDDLHRMEQNVNNLRMPLGKRKKELRKEYQEAMHVLSDSLLEIAYLQDLDQLKDALKNLRSRMHNVREQSSLLNAREILDISETYRADIEAMDFGKETLDDAHQLYQEYSIMALKPGRRRKEASQLYDEYKEQLEKCIQFIRVHIRPYFFRARKQHPNLLALLDDHIDIPQHGKRYAIRLDEWEEPASDAAKSESDIASEESGSAPSDANPDKEEVA